MDIFAQILNNTYRWASWCYLIRLLTRSLIINLKKVCEKFVFERGALLTWVRNLLNNRTHAVCGTKWSVSSQPSIVLLRVFQGTVHVVWPLATFPVLHAAMIYKFQQWSMLMSDDAIIFINNWSNYHRLLNFTKCTCEMIKITNRINPV